ncbi:MAG: radical SAM protein [Candidatus Omnitrophota bacterium]
MKRLEFHISYKCPNNCSFCSEKNQLKKFKDTFVSKETVLNNLKRFARRGFNHLTLTGGEPTLHPDFFEIIRYASFLKYRTYVSSNGGMFSRQSFCSKVIPYLDEVSFSLHGDNACLHDSLTNNPGSFSKLRKAFANIKKRKKKVFIFVNIVATLRNLLYLKDIIEFAADAVSAKQVLISAVAPEGAGKDNFLSLAVPLREMSKYLSSLIDASYRKNMQIRFFGIPMCALGNFCGFSNDAYWSARTTVELWRNHGREFLKVTKSYKPVRNRIKVHKCFRCALRNICGGVFSEYVEEFGAKEVVPFNYG